MNASKRTQNLVRSLVEAAMDHGYQRTEGNGPDVERAEKHLDYMKARLQNRLTRLEKRAALDPGHVRMLVDDFGSANDIYGRTGQFVSMEARSTAHSLVLKTRRNLLAYLGVPDEEV